MRKILILLMLFTLHPVTAQAYVAPDKILRVMYETCFAHYNDLNEVARIIKHWNATEGTASGYERKWRFRVGKTSTDYIDLSMTKGRICELDIPQAGNDDEDNASFRNAVESKFKAIPQYARPKSGSSSFYDYGYTLRAHNEDFYIHIWQTNLGSATVKVFPRSVVDDMPDQGRINYDIILKKWPKSPELLP